MTDNDDLALVCDHHYKAMRKAAKKYLGHIQDKKMERGVDRAQSLTKTFGKSEVDND